MSGCAAAAAFVSRGRVESEKAVLDVSGGSLDVTSIKTTFLIKSS